MTASHGTAAYRLDGAVVPAAAFYAAACDPQRSVVIEACAGAGKTWILVSRILRALVDGAEPHEILAITFTKKAAGEMRERLGQWLAEFGDPVRAEQALVERGVDVGRARTLAPRLSALHARVLDADRPVEIRTFHAWFSQLLRQSPLDLLDPLGLHPAVQLLEDTSDLAPELYRRFHTRVRDDAVLRADYATLVGDIGRHNLRKWLDAALQRRGEIEGADAAGTLATSVADAASVLPECAGLDHPVLAFGCETPHRAGLRRLVPTLQAASKALVRKAGDELAAALAEPDARTAFDRAWQALFTTKGTVRTVLDLDGVDDAADGLRRIRAAMAQHEAHDRHQRMVRLSRALFAEYAALKRARSVADMTDLEQLALTLLRDSEASGWMQQRLDARARHLLIDEFQDTSPLQWHALQAWLASYAGAGGSPPSVLVVGDPKQSIYRFRRAEPRVFAAARDFVVQALGGSVLACDHTRRNAPAVLAVLNPVFEQLGVQGLYEGFRAHTTSAAPGDAAVWALRPGDRSAEATAASDAQTWRDSLTQPRDRAEVARRQAEARQVAAEIAALLAAGTPAGSVMVLARKRAALRELAAELAALQLPYAAVEAQALAESPEVRDLLAMLDVLASPGHDLSLAQVLRSPMFGADEDDLQALAQAADGAGGWWDALMQPGLGAALERARGLLQDLAARAPMLPPHDLLDAVVDRTDLRARLAATLPARRRAGALAAVDALLAQSLSLDGGRYTSIYGFVRALRRRAVSLPMPADPDAVQLLTIHGAKGLEAHTVFVMDSDPIDRRGDASTLLVDWPVDDTAPRCCAFVAHESRMPASLAERYALECAERDREELNSLYVAMTRARERLVFSRTVPARAPSPRSWWARLQPHVAERESEPGAGPATVAKAAAPPVLLELPPWTPPPATPRPDARADDPAAAALGRAVHRVLEWALPAGARPPSPERVAELARAAARAEGLASALAGEVAARVGAILDSPQCRPLFAAEALVWSGNEVVFCDGGELLRLDRLVALDEDGQTCWWVLDYKLNRDPLARDAYREQMRRYRDVVARANPGQAVRAAFITGGGERIDVEFGD